MIDNDITQYNFTLTFTRNGLKSCIDHIYSNCSYKITDAVTQNDILSDHNILTFNYNNNKLNIDPTYKIKRDFNLLNTDILTQYCDMNDRIDTVFDYDMSNDIANILIDEINNIIQTIAFSKLIQCKTGIINGMRKTLKYKLTIRIEWRHF